jgi:hypothetical protein
MSVCTCRIQTGVHLRAQLVYVHATGVRSAVVHCTQRMFSARCLSISRTVYPCTFVHDDVQTARVQIRDQCGDGTKERGPTTG